MPSNDIGARSVPKFDKVTVITGGSKGIGSGCAKVFVEAGASVLICDVDTTNGERVAKDLSSRGPGRCHFEPGDVRKADDLQRVVEKAINRFGRLDCLINNAGAHPPFKLIDNFSAADLRDAMEMNFVSYFVACKLALPYLRQTRGSIINMGSLTSVLGDHGVTTYCAAKGAVSGFTKALAIEEAKNGVRVNSILPGNIMTQSRLELEATMKNRQVFHDYIESWQWLGRSGTIEEVGHTCLFLASDNASFITGTELILSGGAEMGFGPKAPMPQF